MNLFRFNFSETGVKASMNQETMLIIVSPLLMGAPVFTLLVAK